MTDLIARARSLFNELVDLPASERATRLAALAQRDPALHEAVATLLRADDATPDRARIAPPVSRETTATESSTADPRIGTRLGAWRIDRLLARGGMGDVYQAHRDDGQYQQRVALKCIRAELASDELVAAFRDERSHLARLEHPGIASLLDGGIDENGQPWFAMRYIDGLPIDRWCDQRRAGVRERVGLLIQVAQALAYAHAQGVLHRDIKPSNLLVTADGRVQLVDFGVSSRFESMTDAYLAHIALTQEYVAPEIHRGGSVGAAADLYALGVLMYRLLSARTPAPPNAPAAPAAPMTRLLAQAPESIARERGLPSVAALTRVLAGDLSAIALKTVAARPQDRYSSAHEFGEELQRWMQHRPVAAHPVGAWGRLRRLTRRNRIAAVLGCVVLLTLAAGLGFSWRQYRIASNENQATDAVSQLFASTLGTATLSGLGTTPFSSQALLAKTEAQLRRLDLRDHPLVLARGLSMLARSYAVIGDYRHAESLADQAQRALGEETDDDGYVAATRLSVLNNRARYAEAAQLARRRLDELADRHDPPAQRSKVNFNVELAMAQWGLGDTSSALQSLDTAQTQLVALGRGDRPLLAQLLIQRSAFRARMYRLRQAQSDLEQAVALVGETNPVLADDAREQLLILFARYRRATDLPLAERLLRDRRASLGDRHPKTGRAWLLLGYAQFLSNQKVAALQNMRAGQQVIEAAYGRDHPEYAVSLQLISSLAARESRDNVAPLREALRISENALGPSHETTLYLRNILALRLHDLSPEVLGPEDHKEAEALFDQNIRIKRRAGVPAPWEKLMLAHSLLLHGGDEDLAKADALFRDSREDAQRYFSADDNYPAMLALFSIELRYRRGERAQADRDFAGIIERYRDKREYLAQLYLHDSWMHRGLYAYENCDNAQAERLLEQALASERERLGPEHFITRDTASFLEHLREHGRFASGTGAQVPPRAVIQAAQVRARGCAGSARRAAAAAIVRGDRR